MLKLNVWFLTSGLQSVLATIWIRPEHIKTCGSTTADDLEAEQGVEQDQTFTSQDPPTPTPDKHRSAQGPSQESHDIQSPEALMWFDGLCALLKSVRTLQGDADDGLRRVAEEADDEEAKTEDKEVGELQGPVEKYEGGSTGPTLSRRDDDVAEGTVKQPQEERDGADQGKADHSLDCDKPAEDKGGAKASRPDKKLSGDAAREEAREARAVNLREQLEHLSGDDVHIAIAKALAEEEEEDVGAEEYDWLHLSEPAGSQQRTLANEEAESAAKTRQRYLQMGSFRNRDSVEKIKADYNVFVPELYAAQQSRLEELVRLQRRASNLVDGGPAAAELLADLQEAVMSELHREQSQHQAEKADKKIRKPK